MFSCIGAAEEDSYTSADFSLFYSNAKMQKNLLTEYFTPIQ